MSRKNDLIRQLTQSTRGPNNIAADEGLMEQAFALLNAYDFGWADYSNSGAAVNFTPGQWQQVQNDLAGPYTTTSALPMGVAKVMNAGGELNLKELAIGSLIIHRHDLTVTLANNNTEIDLRLRFAIGDLISYTLPIAPPTQMKAAGTYQLSGLSAFYIGNEATRLNPARLEIRSDLDGSFLNAGSFMIVAAR